MGSDGSSDVTKTLLLAAALALTAASHAHASAETTFIAYGTGITRCEIKVFKDRLAPYLVRDVYTYHGKTVCDVPVQQTGHAFVPHEYPFDGGVCSGFRMDCYSGEVGAESDEPKVEPMEYHVTLRAPKDQGWLGAPRFCTGVGTDNLKCVFKANDPFSTASLAYRASGLDAVLGES
jgi:hypothetical protein